MALFLKKTRRRKRSSRPRRSLSGQRPWDPKRTLLGLRVLLAAAAVVIAVLGWRWSEQSLRRYASVHRSVPVESASVELSPRPSWMSDMLADDLRSLVAREVDADPMDTAGLHRAARALQNSPWVRQVWQINRPAGSRVIVRAEYRRPVALIEVTDGYRLVDGQGVCLPGLYLKHQIDSVRLPVLIGVTGRTPRAGKKWSDSAVGSGLALVRLIEVEPYIDQVRAIDLGRRDTRGRMRLAMCTRDGGVVRWGLPPGQEQSIEPSAATKKQRLVEIYRRRGSIDGGGKVVDIFGADVFIHHMDLTHSDEPRSIGYTLR